MKLTQPTLNTALRGLRLVKPRKTSLPVLDCVHLSADGPTVALAVTDLDQRLTFTGELAEPSNRLTRLVPLAILQRVAKEMPKETVFSFAKAGQITCALKNLTTLVPYDAPAPEEFPPPIAVAGEEIELPPAAVTALQEARYVASESESRRNICCVCLEPTGAVATDGSQLFHSNTLALPLIGPCLFPTHKTLGFFDGTAPALLRLPTSEKDDAFTLRQGAWTWQSKFLPEKFPSWRRVLPPDDLEFTQVIFSTENVERLRQIIGLIPDDRFNDPLMALVVRQQRVVAVTGKGASAQTHELHAWTVTGPDTHAWFNARFLLRALDYGFAQLRLRDARTVIVAKDEHREYLFMPKSVEDEQLPKALRPPADPAPEHNNQTNPPTEDPKMNQTTTTTAPASAPEASAPTATSNGHAHPPAANAAEALLIQWLDAREAIRTALDKLDGLRTNLRSVSRDYRELSREHEGLKRSLRSIQHVRV